MASVISEVFSAEFSHAVHVRDVPGAILGTGDTVMTCDASPLIFLRDHPPGGGREGDREGCV